MDKSPASGINYYRIKSLDKLESICYSNVASLTTRDSRLVTFSVYPNSSTDKVTINGNHIATVSSVIVLGR